MAPAAIVHLIVVVILIEGLWAISDHINMELARCIRHH